MPRHGDYPALGSPQVAGKEKLITNLAWPGRRLACNDDFSHRGGEKKLSLPATLIDNRNSPPTFTPPDAGGGRGVSRTTLMSRLH